MISSNPMKRWDEWVEAALSRLSSSNLTRSTRPISLSDPSPEIETFGGPHHRDRSSVEVEMDGPTLRRWLHDLPNPASVAGTEVESDCNEEESVQRKLVLFSGNDYLGMSAHPSVAKAAAKAVEEHGMGPRGSALICGYTNYHSLLEASLAELKKKEM